ncbi:TPA: hypothetical protein G8N60_000356 [Salmonella enterica]|uniref:Uncharacterized protein n=1 Tax=Salmonella enterica TaxID=28901 RepID=A0A743WAS5_SALER|nr:hypothetical protein [Salmonella enterica]
MDESRKQFEYEAGKSLNLPTSMIELARKGDGYDHAFDSMHIMQPLNGWWLWWKKSRDAIEIELQKPKKGSLPGDYHIGYDSGTESQCESDVEAIRAAGVKVKE